MNSVTRIYALQKVSSLQEAGAYGTSGAAFGGAGGYVLGRSLAEPAVQYAVAKKKGLDAAVRYHNAAAGEVAAARDGYRPGLQLGRFDPGFDPTLTGEARASQAQRIASAAAAGETQAAKRMDTAYRWLGESLRLPRRYAAGGALGLGALGAGVGLVS